MNPVNPSLCARAGLVLILSSAIAAHGQSISAAPIKQGLWQTQITSSVQMAVPPDVQARIAAMPAAQQAQVRAMMGGAGGKPTSSTVKSCMAKPTTPNNLMNQAQDKSGATKCTFSNQQQTGSSLSFDVSCTTTDGTASGHAQFAMKDSDHWTGTMNLTMSMSSNGQSTNATMASTSTYTFLGADCGDVKPIPDAQ